jgi:hypothetical protein
VKRYAWLLVFSGLVAAAAAWAVVRWSAPAACAAPAASDRVNDAGWLTRELALSPDQQTAVGEACRAYRAELALCRGAHGTARCALSCRIFDPKATPVELEAAAEGLCRAQMAAENATVTHFRRVHALLTPGQQERYENLIRSCVCGGANGTACEACCGK